MKHLHWLSLTLLALCAQAADDYRIQSDQTRVSFSVRRYGVKWIDARFRQLEGRFVVDREGPGSLIEVSVHTDSLEGMDWGWNSRLRSRDWLDTQRYPRMNFRSTHIEYKPGGGAVAVGQLTLHGVSRPVQLDIGRLECSGQPEAQQLCSFSASANIRRSDFGLPHGFWVAGDAVDISISGLALRGDGHLTAASLPGPPPAE
jgi:polyisoprenoid-binding protein YceI